MVAPSTGHTMVPAGAGGSVVVVADGGWVVPGLPPAARGGGGGGQPLLAPAFLLFAADALGLLAVPLLLHRLVLRVGRVQFGVDAVHQVLEVGRHLLLAGQGLHQQGLLAGVVAAGLLEAVDQFPVGQRHRVEVGQPGRPLVVAAAEQVDVAPRPGGDVHLGHPGPGGGPGRGQLPFARGQLEADAGRCGRAVRDSSSSAAS